MKRFKNVEIWSLLKWILLYEIILVILFNLLNLIVDLEKLFENINFLSFLSFGLFSLFTLVIFEVLGLTQIYLFWYKKYGFVKLPKKEILKKILITGENKKIEFKKSLRWDFEKNELNKELEKSVIKTIAGFLNSKGGNLIIGVSDKKEIIGLEKDFQTLPKKDRDGFENYLTQIIRGNIGSSSMRLIKIEFEDFEKGTICHVKTKSSEDPVYVKFNGNEEFFVRVGNSTASLSISESVNYIKNHWNGVSEESQKSK